MIPREVTDLVYTLHHAEYVLLYFLASRAAGSGERTVAAGQGEISQATGLAKCSIRLAAGTLARRGLIRIVTAGLGLQVTVFDVAVLAAAAGPCEEIQRTPVGAKPSYPHSGARKFSAPCEEIPPTPCRQVAETASTRKFHPPPASKKFFDEVLSIDKPLKSFEASDPEIPEKEQSTPGRYVHSQEDRAHVERALRAIFQPCIAQPLAEDKGRAVNACLNHIRRYGLTMLDLDRFLAATDKVLRGKGHPAVGHWGYPARCVERACIELQEARTEAAAEQARKAQMGTMRAAEADCLPHERRGPARERGKLESAGEVLRKLVAGGGGI